MPPKIIDVDKAVKFYQRGKSIAEIANYFRVSRQAVWDRFIKLGLVDKGIRRATKQSGKCPKMRCYRCDKLTQLKFNPLVDYSQSYTVKCDYCHRLLFEQNKSYPQGNKDELLTTLRKIL